MNCTKVLIRLNTLKWDGYIIQRHRRLLYSSANDISFICFMCISLLLAFLQLISIVAQRPHVPNILLRTFLFHPCVFFSRVCLLYCSMLAHFELCNIHSMGVSLIRIQSSGVVICDRIINFFDA